MTSRLAIQTVANPLLALLLTASAPANPVIPLQLETPPRLTVGDRFDVTLKVSSPARSIVTGPLADSMGVFVVGGEQRKTAMREGRAETTYRLSLAGFRPGTHRLPEFVFVIHGDGTADTLRSDTASVTIASVLPEKMTDINALKPAESFPNPWVWIVPAAALLLAALAYAVHRLYRQFRRGRELAEAPLPPWDEALGALDALPWREWLGAGQIKRYYYALSEVLKRYIERRFEFAAAEQTTTEMLASMRFHRTPMRDDVARFFARSDLVKYAKLVPPEEESETAIAQVREFVLKTRPQEPAAAGPVAAAGSTPAPAAGPERPAGGER